MAATALTKKLGGTFGDGVADVGFEAVDSVNNNSFVNTGKERIDIANASGSPITVTFVSVPASKFTINDVLVKTPTATSVAAGETNRFGPFSPAIYGATIEIAFSSGTSVTAAVVQDEPTPV